jgi:hypothetical protein
MDEPFVTAPLNVTVAFESAGTAEMVDGTEAAPCVVNDPDDALDEFPTALTATTANVYAVPSVNPEHV